MDLIRFYELAGMFEFDDGETRFRAETKAAARLGAQRWEVLNEIKRRDFERSRDQRQASGGQPANNLPAMQPDPKEETRPVSERDVPAGRHRLEMLALRLG